MENIDTRKSVVMSSAYKVVPDVTKLDRIGAGHDGIVYRYGDFVFKLLKYDILERKIKNLMTFEKATYFVQNLSLKRVAQPVDVLLDMDGVYTGYVMKFYEDVSKNKKFPYYQAPGDFLMRDMYRSIDELEEDVGQLSSKYVSIKDINRGSYIYTKNYLVMCDMDKFQITTGIKAPVSQNRSTLHFFISKALFYEMERSEIFTKDELKQLIRWVKKSSNSCSFLQELRKECLNDPNYPIREYAKEKGKSLLR